MKGERGLPWSKEFEVVAIVVTKFFAEDETLIIANGVNCVALG